MSNVDKIVHAASKYLSGPALEFFACQLRCSGKKSHGRRWTAEDKMLALSIFHRSAAAYRFLCTCFALPSIRSLRRWLQGMRFEPGFCDRVFEILRLKTQHMSYSDKFCVLCVDEMAVKQVLEFDRKRDIVDGFQDDGITRDQKPANEALVFMVKGLFRKWKNRCVTFCLMPPWTVLNSVGCF